MTMRYTFFVRFIWLILVASLPISAGVLGKERQLVLWYEKFEAESAFTKLGQQFHAETGITLVVQHMPTGDLKASSIRAVGEGVAPDIIFAPSDFIGNRAILKLSEIAEPFSQPMIEGATSSVTDGGKQYGVPLLYGNHLMLYFNKSLVAESANSWAGLIAQREIVEGKGVNLIAWKPMEMYWVIPFLTAFGGVPVDDNGIQLGSPEIAKGLEYYRQQTELGVINMRCSYECVYEKFIAGEYAYAINGDWAFNQLKQKLGLDFGVAMLPKVDGARMRSMSSSITLMFPGDALNGHRKSDIDSFVRFMLTADAQRVMYQETGMMPTTTQAYSEIKQSFKDDPDMAVFFAQMEHTIPMPPSPEMSAAWIGMAKGVALYMRGKATGEQAVEFMQTHAERELRRQSETQK
ncbi:extracellular solute-binding protein [Corallincola holothuriorum]|uniref:Extracellular solute-binding protein n=2 Tax=Corallincola holothuriorum TaxID=2282215 RepID=A0A368NTE7_9GAMM|nr:extracellular solute-binding protein [Corallincola holothuriorum]